MQVCAISDITTEHPKSAAKIWIYPNKS